MTGYFLWHPCYGATNAGTERTFFQGEDALLCNFRQPPVQTQLQCCLSGPVAQLVEQRIENPRVGSSILPQATISSVVAHEKVLQIP